MRFACWERGLLSALEEIGGEEPFLRMIVRAVGLEELII
jgi:hypothetical protein